MLIDHFGAYLTPCVFMVSYYWADIVWAGLELPGFNTHGAGPIYWFANTIGQYWPMADKMESMYMFPGMRQYNTIFKA